MKQLLLRVPEDLHSRLMERAASSGRSINALANEILTAAVRDAADDRRARLRARLAAAGKQQPADAARVSASAARRDAVVSSTRGLGPLVDRLPTDGPP